MAQDYQRVEELLSRLLALLAPTFSAVEILEIREFVEVGEYGLALETLVDIVIEENKHIPGEEVNRIYELADAMNLDRK